MRESPKGLRRHIALLGRRNAGKSSLLNALANQDVAIVSDIAGTTTDPVEKTMEINGLGPVVLVDTAGVDDTGVLGSQRIERSLRVLRRMDMAIIVLDSGAWGESEETLASMLRQWNVPFVVARNKADLEESPKPGLPDGLEAVNVSAKSRQGIRELVDKLAALDRQAESRSTPLVADLAPENGLVVFVTPIDTGAPEGRLILPQVQSIRDCLDGKIICMVLTEAQYAAGLAKLKHAPDLVVCDSQVVRQVAEQTPENWRLTTFSILMARFKGNLVELARGAAALKKLKPGDRVLIQEACSHHPQKDDIGRVKIPKMLQKLAGGELDISFSAGKEFNEYDPEIRAVIHCGACVITKKQMLARQGAAKTAGCPMTNYGVAISLAQGALPRTLAIFPEALAAFQEETGGTC